MMHYKEEEGRLKKISNMTVDKIFKLLLGSGKVSEVILGFLRPRELMRVICLDRETWEVMSHGRVMGMIFE